MAETSYPIVGQDLTDSAWAQTVGSSGHGVLDDWGSPYAIVVNTNDTVTIKPSTTSGIARAVVSGFGHQIDAAVTLSVPAVTSQTTYYVGLLRDPANAAQPVLLTVLKGTTVPLTSGQTFLTLYQFVRSSGQTLAASTLYRLVPRLRRTLLVQDSDALQQMSPRLFLYGTEAYCSDTGHSYRASGSATSPKWEPQTPLELETEYANTGDVNVISGGSATLVAGRQWNAGRDRLVLVTVTATIRPRTNANAAGNVYVTLNDDDITHPSPIRVPRIAAGSQVMVSLTVPARTAPGGNTVRVRVKADSTGADMVVSYATIGVVAIG